MNQSLESNRKRLLKQQTALRKLMTDTDQFTEAFDLFFNQHAMLHSAKISAASLWSFEDSILDDMSHEQIRRIPDNCEHSVAWCFWHMARIEDVTMNLLVAGRSQVIHQDSWLKSLRSPIHDTGNALNKAEMIQFTSNVDIDSLRAYRLAVGHRTREIVRMLQPLDLKRKVDLARLEQVMAEEAVDRDAQGIVDYWSKRTIAGLLLMPATRHNLVHLNEALKLKGRRN